MGTEDVFKPGFTSYYERCQYQFYDITSLLMKGENVLAVALGNGWWRGTTGGTVKNNFGYKVAYLGQIVLTYGNGNQEVITSDETFQTSTGAYLESDMRAGKIPT